jgi:hypothetical protein
VLVNVVVEFVNGGNVGNVNEVLEDGGGGVFDGEVEGGVKIELLLVLTGGVDVTELLVVLTTIVVLLLVDVVVGVLCVVVEVGVVLVFFDFVVCDFPDFVVRDFSDFVVRDFLDFVVLVTGHSGSQQWPNSRLHPFPQ